jgi:Flp pilus assembly protein TadG
MLNRQTVRRCRRGSALLYVTMTMTVMIAFVALGVDWGRVQLVKTELQTTADAAARYAASGVLTSAATARDRAIASGAENTANGSAVVLTAADVVTGNWNTATFAFTANGTPRNAVQVTARRAASRGTALSLPWAGLVPGVDNTVDVSASATAYAEAETYKGFIGYDSFAAKNNAVGASYNSSVDTDPTSSSAAANGMFGTNGIMEAKNNSVVRGNLYLGPAGVNDGLGVTGSTPRLASPIPKPTVPTWNPGVNPGAVPQAYSVATATLPGGTYWFTSLSVSNSLSFTGPATVYVNGDVTLNGKLIASGEIPANLRIYVLGADRTFGNTASNHMDLCAQVVAPGADLQVKNNLKFRGWGLFQTIETKNNAEYYFDESDGPAGPSSAISLVR